MRFEDVIYDNNYKNMRQNKTVLIFLLLIGLTTSLSETVSSDSSSESTDPIVEFVVGIILFILSFPILWYNEYKQRYLKFRAAINEVNILKAKKQCTSISSEYMNPAQEGQLVHIIGDASTNDVIFSKKFGVEISQIIYLEREVQTYSWVKHEKTEGTGKNKRTIITYEKEWKKIQQENYDYPHENPESFWTVKHKMKYAKNVNVGVYQLTKSLKKQALNKILINPQDQWISYAGTSYPDRKQQLIHINGDYLYFSQISGSDTIGDQRIQFYYVPCGEVTIVSKLKGETFDPFSLDVQTERLLDDYDERKRHSSIYIPDDFKAIISDERLGPIETINRLLEPIKVINWLIEKKLKKDEIFNLKLAQSRKLTWYVRLFGYLLMVFGLFLMFQPVVWLISWFPLLGNFLGELSTALFYCAAILIAIPLTILTIAIAWLRFHPIIALIMLLSCCCTIGIIWLIM